MQARESFYTLSEFNAAVEKLATRADLQALAARFDSGFDQINGRFQQVDGRFQQVEGRLDGVENRLFRVEGRLDRIEGRLDRVETKLDSVALTVATLEERSRHGATRSWVLTGVVGALLALLSWMSRTQLFPGLQAAGF